MVCIYCSSTTAVINSRPQKKLNKVWRRRRCEVCQAVFSTIEATDLAGSILVRRKTQMQPFSRDKLLLSVYGSLLHRKTAVTDASGLTDTIVGRLMPLVKDASIEAPEIIKVTSEVLKRFDRVAATHYQAFHP